jgi:predicted nucleic acid-binding protein
VTYILDTDHISLLQQKNLLVRQHLNAIYALESQTVVVTVISVQEQMRGWLNAINQSRKEERILWSYEGLANAVQLLNTFPILQFDRAAYNIFFGVEKSENSYRNTGFKNRSDRTFSQRNCRDAKSTRFWESTGFDVGRLDGIAIAFCNELDLISLGWFLKIGQIHESFYCIYFRTGLSRRGKNESHSPRISWRSNIRHVWE